MTHGEFEREFAVPYDASRFVLTLLPFSNSSTRVGIFSTAIDPVD